MKVLIVAGTFPPYAPSSAGRANKFAKFLEDNGHEVRVLAPKLPGQDKALSPEISADKITFTDYFNINDVPTTYKNKLKNLFKKNKTTTTIKDGNGSEKPIKKSGDYKESRISRLYRNITNIPDATIGWYPEAVRSGRRLIADWSPDIIFSTAPPYTSFVVARKLAKLFNIPWIADYRDLWIDDSHYQSQSMRGKVNKLFENWLLSNCNGIVTVTDTWKNSMAKRYNMPVINAMNGYDPADFDQINENVLYPDHYTILYAGVLYEGRRDPSVLFEALGKLGDKKEKFKILLYINDGINSLTESQRSLIDKYDLHDQVVINKFIPQRELLEIEMGVDQLLLLRWDNPAEDGVIAGKLFEYIGAGKEILSVGSTTGEAADIIRNNNFGLVSNDADEIAVYLEKQLSNKENHTSTKTIPVEDQIKFARSIQFEKIEQMLDEIVNRS